MIDRYAPMIQIEAEPQITGSWRFILDSEPDVLNLEERVRTLEERVKLLGTIILKMNEYHEETYHDLHTRPRER